jgi:hypothetical protein
MLTYTYIHTYIQNHGFAVGFYNSGLPGQAMEQGGYAARNVVGGGPYAGPAPGMQNRFHNQYVI